MVIMAVYGKHDINSFLFPFNLLIGNSLPAIPTWYESEKLPREIMSNRNNTSMPPQPLIFLELITRGNSRLLRLFANQC